MKKTTLKKILLLLTAFCGYFLAITVYINALSSFLSKVGPQFLPYAMLMIGGFLILDSIASAVAARRFNAFKIFRGALLLFIAAFSVLMFLDPGSLVTNTYYLVLAHSFLLLIDIYIVNASSALLTPLQMKSHMPKNYSMDAMARIAGSFFAAELAAFQVQLGIGLYPVIFLILILVLVEATRFIFRKEVLRSFIQAKEKGLLKDLKKNFGYIRKTSLYRTLTAALVLIIGAKILVNFKMKTVLGFTFSEDTLTEVLGYVLMADALLTWLISVFISKKALFRFGVSNMMLFYPISLLAILAVTIFTHMHYLAIIVLFVIINGSHVSYYRICEKQILSVVPQDKNQSVYFIIRGLFFSFAYLLFSAFLLIFAYDINLEPTLNTLAIIVLLAAAIFEIVILRKRYNNYLKNNLFQDDDFLRSRSIELLAEKTSKNKGEIYLRRLLSMENISHQTKSSVMNSLGIIGNHQTIVDLVKVLKYDDDSKNQLAAINAINMIIKDSKSLDKFPVTKYLLLRTYEELFLRNVPTYLKLEVIHALKYFDLVDVIDFLERHLESDEPEIKMNIIQTFGNFNDRGIIPYLEPFLESDDVRIVRSAMVGLWQFEEMRVKLLPKFIDILTSKGKENIENALFLIEAVNAHWEKDYVLRQLKHSDKHIRLHALVTIIRLGALDKIDEYVRELIEVAESENFLETEFALSRYRQLDEKVKKIIIHKLQQMEEGKVNVMCRVFSDSKYSFENELSALS